jgi:hypothetical protein
MNDTSHVSANLQIDRAGEDLRCTGARVAGCKTGHEENRIPFYRGNIRAIVVTFPVLAKLTILVSSVARIIHPGENGRRYEWYWPPEPGVFNFIFYTLTDKNFLR